VCYCTHSEGPNHGNNNFFSKGQIMAEDMRVNDQISTAGSYSRRWLLKSAATVTAIAAAAVTLGPRIAGAESLTKTPSPGAAAAVENDYLEIGGI
jgi:hypothetical protein